MHRPQRSSRSAGKELIYRGAPVPVELLCPEAFDDVDLAIASTPDDVAADFIPQAVDRKTIVVDESGYYLKHDDPGKTFGSELGVDYRFQNDEPELAAYAASNDQFFRRHGQHDNELDGFQKIYFAPNDSSRYWLLTLNIPDSLVFADTNYALNSSLQFSLFFGLLSLLIIVWYISRKILTFGVSNVRRYYD